MLLLLLVVVIATSTRALPVSEYGGYGNGCVYNSGVNCVYPQPQVPYAPQPVVSPVVQQRQVIIQQPQPVQQSFNYLPIQPQVGCVQTAAQPCIVQQPIVPYQPRPVHVLPQRCVVTAQDPCLYPSPLVLSTSPNSPYYQRPVPLPGYYQPPEVYESPLLPQEAYESPLHSLDVLQDVNVKNGIVIEARF